MTALGIIWFLLAVLLIALFAVLDGFDLGAGVLYGVEKDEGKKARIIGAVSPFWNGNEVWLIAGIGSLLAAFPPVYSSLLSTLYVPVMLVLVGIILRACGIELRSKVSGPFLSKLLDWSVFLGSLIPAWATGLVAGNVLLGFPLDGDGDLKGSFLFFLRPYALLLSLASLAAFVAHGALYLAVKSDGDDRKAYLGSAAKALTFLAALAVLDAVAAPFFLGARFAEPGSLVLFGLFAVLALAAWGASFVLIRSEKAGLAFAASFGGIACTAFSAGSLMFPTLLPSTVDPKFSLNIANAASSDSSLLVMLVIALIAVPLIGVYMFLSYRAFRGKAGAVRY